MDKFKLDPKFHAEGSCCCGSITEKTAPVIAMASVPCQVWSEPYDMATALKEGTIFPDLNKPFFKGGNDDVR